MSLSIADWVVVGLFIAGVFALGFSAKLRSNSTLQFLAAGRNLTLPFFVTSLVATWYGGILGMGESVQYYGLGTWLLLGLPYYLFAAIYALFYAGRVRAEDQISLPERLAASFGKPAGVVAAVLVFLIGLPAAHVLMLGVLVQSLTGWDLTVAVVVATIGGSLFLYRGGLLADVRVSVLAFLMMYIGFAVMVGYCLLNHPVGETWSKIEPASHLTFTGGQGALVIVSFLILGAWTLIDPGFHQRVAAAESPLTSKKGVWISTVCWIVFDLLSISAGMYAMALVPTPPDQPLLLFPALGEAVLPSVLKGIFLCGMLGTILCAMVGYALVGGASIGRDLVCRIRPGLDETKWSRIGIAVACLLAIVVAIRIQSVVTIWYAWGGIVVGALLIPVTWSYLIRRPASRLAVTISMAASAFVSGGWLIYGIATENPFLMIKVPAAWLGYTAAGGAANEWTEFSLGTLIPGLAVSALVIALGQALKGARRRNGSAGRTDEYADL